MLSQWSKQDDLPSFSEWSHSVLPEALSGMSLRRNLQSPRSWRKSLTPTFSSLFLSPFFCHYWSSAETLQFPNRDLHFPSPSLYARNRSPSCLGQRRVDFEFTYSLSRDGVEFLPPVTSSWTVLHLSHLLFVTLRWGIVGDKFCLPSVNMGENTVGIELDPLYLVMIGDSFSLWSILWQRIITAASYPRGGACGRE